ncbi:MAG: hypothetical protein ACLFNT_06665 [Spirochaetales bacterium]
MKRFVLILSILLIGSALAFAGGGGGVFEGRMLPYRGWASTDLDATVGGGFGYGIARDGSRIGGFGLVVNDEFDEELYGAFGGLISGRQYKMGPIVGSVNLWTGVGYVSPRLFDGNTVGYVGELNAELGVLLVPWMQIAVYGGMQGMGSFYSEKWFSDFTYSPVAGIRAVWGSF